MPNSEKLFYIIASRDKERHSCSSKEVSWAMEESQRKWAPPWGNYANYPCEDPNNSQVPNSRCNKTQPEWEQEHQQTTKRKLYTEITTSSLSLPHTRMNKTCTPIPSTLGSWDLVSVGRGEEISFGSNSSFKFQND